MFYDIGHPHVAPSDWQTFRKESSPHLTKEVIDRSEIKLPDWFAPLARGVAIASDALLRKAGYRPGSYRPRGWHKTHCDVFERVIHPNDILPGDMGPKSLMVRQYCNQRLWTIERWGGTRRYEQADEVLVCQFGSTPIFTRNYQSAMWLAEYCQVNGPPHGLRWIAACPDDKDGAIEFARQRREGEAACTTSAQSA